MQDTILELEYQGIQKEFTMLQVRKLICLTFVGTKLLA